MVETYGFRDPVLQFNDSPYTRESWKYNLDLYNPEIHSFLIFLEKGRGYGRSTGPNSGVLTAILKSDELVQVSGRMLVISSKSQPLNKKDVSGDTGVEANWSKISVDDIKKNQNKIKLESDKRGKNLESSLVHYNFIGSFIVLVTGNRERYWTEPQFELDGEYAAKNVPGESHREMSSILNLDLLNRELFGANRIMCARITTSIFEGEFFAFASHRSDKKKAWADREISSLGLGDFLLTYGMNSNGVNNTTEGERINREGVGEVVRRLSIYIGYQYCFEYKNKYTLSRFEKRVNDTRKNIYHLQKDINQILESEGDGHGKSRRSPGENSSIVKDSQKRSGDVIYDSSVLSTNLTEINENLANDRIFLEESERIVEELEREGLKELVEPAEMRNILKFLPKEMSNWRISILSSFRRLSGNIGDLLNRLNNMVDVFNTYRESRRRVNRKRMTNALNIIFSALALVEVSDYLGGLIIYGMKTSDWMGTFKMFLEATMFLLFIALLLYMFVYKGLLDKKK